MPRKSKSAPRKWTDKLDEAEVNEAMDEACVDAYGEDEQHSGLLTMIEDEVEFPFPAMVLGEEVEVVDIEWPQDDPFGLDLVCQRGGKRYPIEARSVELLAPFPEGHLYLAAYLAWKRNR
jgi:hypothetical protein